MSSSSSHTSKTPKKKDTAAPLALEDTLRDLAILRASSVDLSSILSSTLPATTTTTATTTGYDDSVARSYEFARATRAVVKTKDRADVEAQMVRVDDVRGKLEEVLAGLQD